MPTDDLLNASRFLDEPVGAETQVEDRSIGGFKGETEEIGISPADYLPDTWNIAGYDTGIPLKKSTAATLVGLGHGLSDTWRGIQQIFGKEELKLSLQAEQNHMTDLYNDPRFGTTARVGQMGGFVADPIGVILPVSKGKNLWDVFKVGAATGAAFGGLGYVDESQGQTRVGNALIGTVAGGVLSPTLFAASRGIKGMGGKIQERASNQLLKTYKKEYYKFLTNGATPHDAQKFAMERMQWTTEDKASLILASRKPFKLDKPYQLDAYGTPKIKDGRLLIDEAKAAQNLQALQSRTITNVNNWLDKSEFTKSGKQAIMSAGSAIRTGVVPMITRVAGIDTHLAREIMSFEAHVHKGQAMMHKKLAGFNQALKKMGLDVSEDIRFHAQNGRVGKARELFLANGGSAKDWDVMRGILRKSYNDLNEAGYELPKLKNYFPRRVKDLEGLAKHEDLQVSEAIRAFRQRMRRDPSDKELNKMLDRIVNPTDKKYAQTGGSLRSREKDLLEKAESKYYHKMDETLMSYVNDAVTDIERAKLFRKLGVKKGKFNIDGSDVSENVDDIIRAGRAQGRYGEGEVKNLTDLLRSRFTSGEIAPTDAVQFMKNSTYIATLGNFKSAMTQLGDLAFAAHRNGIINVSLEIMNRIPGLKRIIKNSHTRVTKEQIGLEDAIQEFAGQRNGKKQLDWILKRTGFKAMDRFGKETYINSHMRKVKKLLNGKKSTAEANRLRMKWKKVFGDETEQMIEDLRKGVFSDNVGVYLFNNLEEVQPIALSSMPKAYLDNPNGRILYMLKSFTLKQLDLMRRDIYDNLAKGDYNTGFKNLTSLGTLFVLANGSADMLKDFMSGKEVEMEDTLVDNVWKLMGINRYTAGKFDDAPGQAIIDMVAPPITVYDRAIRSLGDGQKMYESLPFNGSQAFRNLIMDGTFKNTDTNNYYEQLGTAHDSLDYGVSLDE